VEAAEVMEAFVIADYEPDSTPVEVNPKCRLYHRKELLW